MIPASTSRRLVRAAKAGSSRGSLNRQSITSQHVVQAAAARHLTLPPGSVRGYPYRGGRHFDDGYNSDNDDDKVYRLDSRPRVQVSMAPNGRYYGTMEISGTYNTPVVHTPDQSTLDEEFDAWGVHTSATGEISLNYGAPVTTTHGEYTFAVAEPLRQISFPTETSDAASAPFPELEEDELKEYMTTFYDGGMSPEANDSIRR